MKPTTSPTSVADLRSTAEASLPARAVVDETPAAQTPEAMLERLRHLEVHQLELELANAEMRRAQLELEVSHARYFNFYNHAPVGYCTLGENGIISEANLTLANLLGVAPGALIGTPFQHFILRADQDWFYLLRQQITESCGALARELQLVRSAGPACWVNLVATEDTGDDGSVRLQLVVTDITERKKSDQTMSALRLRYETLLQSGSDGVHVLDIQGNVVEGNAAFAAMLGYTADELLKLNIADWDAQSSRAELKVMLEELATNPAKFETPKVIETRQRRKDGSLIDVKLSVIGVNLEGRKYFYCCASDLTARKTAEAALRVSEERLQYAVEATLDGIWDWDISSGTAYFSPQWARLLGYESGELLARVESFFTLVHPDDVGYMKQTLADHFAGHTPVKECEIRLHTKTGGYRWFLDCGKVVARNSAGEPTRMVGTISDITARKHTEDLLRRSEQRLNDAQCIAHLGNFHWDARTNRVIWSDELYRIYGREVGEFEPSLDNYVAAIHTDDRAQVVETLRGAMVANGMFFHDYRIGLPTGVERWVHARGCALTDTSGNFSGLEGVCQDITERKQAMAELAKTNGYLVEAQRIAHLGGWYLDTATDHVRWSEELYKMFGVDPALPPPPYSEHAKLFTPESWARLSAALPLTRATGEPYELELETVRADGGYGWMWVRGEVVRNAEGETIGMRGVAQDITERKRAELSLRQLNDELEQRVAERTVELQRSNDELDAFSHSVSHDLRAPLRAIAGFSEFLTEEYAATFDERGRSFLRHITEAAEQMSGLVQALLQLAHASRSELRQQPVNLSALAQEVVSKLNHSMPQYPVEFHCAPSLMVNGDARLLNVVLMNLLGNAWKYTRHTAKPRVELGRLAGAGQPTFFIQDNGAGFDMQYVNRLFGAFQRLHSAGEFEGTGVGLATVQRIIHRHAGKIWGQGKVNEGATFYFTLPDPRTELTQAETATNP